MPHEIPMAIRSRCLEVFFRPLRREEIARIGRNAAEKIDFALSDGATEVLQRFANNGREAVNIIQIAGGLALADQRREITQADIEWVINSGQSNPRPDYRIPEEPQVGLVNGLAVFGPNMGTLIEVEATAIPTAPGTGKLTITGVMEEEEMGGPGVTMRRRSMARSSVDNVLTVLRRNLGVQPRDYDIHVNFPGGIPVDGPSAGLTMVMAIYSAITGIPIKNTVAMTGEVSIRGAVKPVGGVVAKIEAARLAGVKTAIIPQENWQNIFEQIDDPDFKVIPVSRVEEAIKLSTETGAAEFVENAVRRSVHGTAGGLPATV